MVTEKNIIKKLNIEVQTPSVTVGTQFNDEIGDFFKNEIIPEMDIQLDEMAKQFPNKIVRFDHIELDIHIDKSTSFKKLKPLILTALKKQIAKDTPKENRTNTVLPHVLTTAKNKGDAFLFFIEAGTYPWWYDSKKIFTKTDFQNMLEVSSFSEKLKQKLKDKHIQKRIIFQFDFEMIEAIYTAIADSKEIQHASYTVTQTSRFQSFKVPFWSAVFDYSYTKKEAGLLQKIDAIISSIAIKKNNKTTKNYQIELSFLKEVSKIVTYINELLNLGILLKKTKQENIRLTLDKNTSPSASTTLNNETLKSIESKMVTYSRLDTNKVEDEFISITKNDRFSTKISDEGILVQNAGLVILHPYIPLLFERLDFLSEDSEGKLKKTIKPNKVATAVHLLHYLACRKEQPYEHELTVEKYLCGLPLEQSLERMISLSEEQKEQCNSLLKAVLDHWKALGSSNIELLQNEFLVREGKLFFTKDTEKIYVQRKVYDLLLDKIPWNLALAKFPWKQKMIHIEW